MDHAGAPFATLPGLLRATLDQTSTSMAFSWREAGYWRRLSTEEFAALVRRLCLGLVDLGVKPGDAVGLLAPSSPHWLAMDLAIQTAGAVTVPMFTNLAEETFLWEVENTAARWLVVIGESGWKLARPHHKRFTTVVVKGARGDHGHVIDWQDLLERGDRRAEAEPRLHARLRDAVQPQQPATIIHTSGSTGKPKGVVLTHANLVSQVLASAQAYPLEAGRDRALSCLPLAHVFERMVMYYYLSAGIEVWFCDDVKNVGPLLREVRPTCLTAVPRLIEKVHARILSGIEGGNAVKRRIGHWALDRADHHDPAAPHAVADSVAEAVFYKQVRAALGGRLRYCIVGGAPLADDLVRFLLNVGVPVYIGYGLTEASPVLASTRPGATRIGTVGKPFPGVEVRIGEHDEILGRGPGIMAGYHRDPAATAAVIDAEGWLHTGDCGRFDAEGFLHLTGRIKELLKTSNGKYVAPVPIEQAFSQHPLVDQALVVAEGRRFASALLFANREALVRAKQRDGCERQGDADYAAGPQVAAALAELAGRVNAGLDHWQQVRRWTLVLDAPSVENGQLTPTMKLRRHAVCEQYRALIDHMYNDAGDGLPAAPARGTLAPSP
jgi:long-chain acyl-CoA synthetase